MASLRDASATPTCRVEATDPHVLAVDLGTGGPKVALLAATGRVVAHAFRAVGIDLTEDGGAEQSPDDWRGARPGVVPPAFRAVGIALTEDGGAEQSPDDWWDAVVASARRVLADSGVPPEDVV